MFWSLYDKKFFRILLRWEIKFKDQMMKDLHKFLFCIDEIVFYI